MTADTPAKRKPHNGDHDQQADRCQADEAAHPEAAHPEAAHPENGLTEKVHGQKKDRSPERPPQPEPEKAHPFDGTLDF